MPCNKRFEITNDFKVISEDEGIHYIKKYALVKDYVCEKCSEILDCVYVKTLEQREKFYRDKPVQIVRPTPAEIKRMEDDDAKIFRRKK